VIKNLVNIQMKNITKINITKIILFYINLSIIGYNREDKLRSLFYNTKTIIKMQLLSLL
jgi:hypothetical protein